MCSSRTSRSFTNIRVVGFNDAGGGLPGGSVHASDTLTGSSPLSVMVYS